RRRRKAAAEEEEEEEEEEAEEEEILIDSLLGRGTQVTTRKESWHGAATNFERERKRRVSPAVNSRVQHQQQQQYGSSARNSASSGTHG
ncbi:unnamed protein product, partial [Sphagnum compactum]